MIKKPGAVGVCLIVNAIGMIGYAYFCSRLWSGMPEHKLDPDDGPSAITWFLTAVPFMAVCALFDAAVLVWAAYRVFVGRRWGLLLAWCVVIGAWVGLQFCIRWYVAAGGAPHV